MKLVENYEDNSLPKLVLYSKGNKSSIEKLYGKECICINTRYSDIHTMLGMRFSEVIVVKPVPEEWIEEANSRVIDQEEN